jgi:hypothetical protein
MNVKFSRHLTLPIRTIYSRDWGSCSSERQARGLADTYANSSSDIGACVVYRQVPRHEALSAYAADRSLWQLRPGGLLAKNRVYGMLLSSPMGAFSTLFVL